MKPVVFLLFTTLPFLCFGTLSKSDRKTAKKQRTPDGSKKENKAFFKLSQSEKERLLEQEDVIFDGKKKFRNPTLAYVTPWNGKGYDVAKFAAKKFSHISPVWFQVNPSVNERTCTIEGTQDINQGWIADVRSNNSEVFFVPRFIFEKWTKKNYLTFVNSETWQVNCIKRMINLILRNQMQGAVLEVWTQMVSILDSELRNEMVEFITSAGHLFHGHHLQLFVTIPAELDALSRPMGMIQPSEVAKLAESVDFLHVMTYDFKADMLRGVSPLFWIRDNIKYLLGTSSVAPKILLGINFYGYQIKTKRFSPVMASSFKELLLENDAEVYWDGYSDEHFAYSRKREEMTYYPSLDSISKRLELAEALGVGIGIWEIGQGFAHFTKVL